MDQLPVTSGGADTDPATSPSKLMRPRSLHGSVAIALIAIVGLYAGFAMQQYTQLHDQHQRELSNAAAQLKSSLDNALETVSRIRGGTSSCDFDKKQPYLELVPTTPCSQIAGPLKVSMSTEENQPLTLIATAPQSPPLAFRFRADVALGELSFPESFGLLFIADERGRILYQDAPSKRVWLRHLRWGEQRLRDSTASNEGHANLSQAEHIFGNDGTNGWQRLSALSGRTTLQLAGNDHAVYFEPLTVESDSRIHLVLGGAVSRRAMIRQALAVDSYFLAVLVFLLLLAVLGLPFVKLLSLNAHERFDLRDVTLLHLSTAALLAVFTCAIETMNGYVRWNEAAAQGLEQLADRLASDVLEEVGAIQSAVEGYDRQVGSDSPKTLETFPPVTNWLSSTDPRLAPPEPATHIENLSWIDTDGRQLWRLTDDTIGAKQSGLAGRPYFRAVHDDRLFTIDGATRFYLGPDRSLTNGKFYTFLSMPSRVGQNAVERSAEGGKQKPVVVLASAHLASLHAVALPAGYGYAVIDRAGRTLYHSDRRLSLRENLFDEMSAGMRARSIAYAENPSSLTSAYRERPHAFHLRPLGLKLATAAEPSAPPALAGLYVVTFRDTSLDMATAARTFLQALCGLALLLVVIVALCMGAMALVTRRKEDHWSMWLWPKGLAHVYPAISAALVVVLSASLFGLAGGARDIVIMGLPIVALGVVVTIYRFSSRPSAIDVPRSTGWHTFMFLLLLVCTIVVPASAFFRTALGLEFGKRIATEQAWMAAQCADFPRAIRADALAEGRPPRTWERVAASAEAGCTHHGGVRALPPYDLRPTVFSATSHWLLMPYHWADGLLPVTSDYDVRVRYQTPVNSDASRLASGPFPWSTRWGFASYSALLAALAWWLRKRAVFLFLADRTSQAQQTTSAAGAWEGCSPAERLVLARVVLDGMVNPYQRPLVEGLIGRGVLFLQPNLKPSDDLCRYIWEREVQLRQQLRASEQVESSHSWRFARGVLVASGIGLVVFLFATQPALQTEFVGMASAVSGALAALMKVWDTFTSRSTDRKLGRGSPLVSAD